MIDRSPEKRKQAIRDVKKMNPGLTIASIAAMVDRSNKTVESWLYEYKSAPELGDLYIIHNCILAANLVLPKSLKQLQQRIYNHTYVWLQKSGYEKNKRGAPGKHRGDEIRYVYHDKPLLISEISKQSGKGMQTILSRIQANDVAHGEDITELVDAPLQIGKPQNTYIVSGKKLTIQEIADSMGIPKNKLYYKLKKSCVNQNDDITDLLSDVKKYYGQ